MENSDWIVKILPGEGIMEDKLFIFRKINQGKWRRR